MARVVFTPHLRMHLDCPDQEAAGDTVRSVLESVFARHPRLRGYVLDDQGAVRQHVVLFLDGRPVADRAKQSDPVRRTSELYVMQALSGG